MFAGTTQNLVALGPIGQEFLPTLALLEIVQVMIRDWSFGAASATDFIAKIRENSINGPILGVSQTLTLQPLFDGVATFEFSTVALIPTTLYVMEIVQITNTNIGWGIKSTSGPNSTYPGGRAIAAGQPSEGSDLWFREGVNSLVPVKSMTWGRLKGVYR